MEPSQVAGRSPINSVVSQDDIASGIDWERLFGRSAPVEVDIGSGKARFLIESAQANPETNYFGIEKSGKPFHIGVERIAKSGVPNVRVIRDDAHRVIGEKVPAESVSAYHILFPDPWPKKRHHKRRIITPAFVAQLARTLRVGGSLHIATDIADYYDELALIVESNSAFRLASEGEYGVDSVATNFAARYRDQGREMYRGTFVRSDREAARSQTSGFGS
ncbi:tRNA (guanosine(46)-N7)-methyltransferase TrmB [Candidatus Poribacteria bacterium]|nr:tRNA (guanosine(46)-N7)-methyltransferase TrmB [Candidatus Poribacteria bacterium]